MRSAMQDLGISAGWADALFVSALQRGQHPTAGQVRQAVTEAIRAFGRDGCAERMAQEFGDHPETAVIRMRWAREQVSQAFSELAPKPARRRITVRPPAACHSHAA